MLRGSNSYGEKITNTVEKHQPPQEGWARPKIVKTQTFRHKQAHATSICTPINRLCKLQLKPWVLIQWKWQPVKKEILERDARQKNKKQQSHKNPI